MAAKLQLKNTGKLTRQGSGNLIIQLVLNQEKYS